jgi:F-type H+-transporting ATPase subunit epsilon
VSEAASPADGGGLRVEIVTPEAVMFSGRADMVVARGLAGEVGILRGHEPIVVALDFGELRLYAGDAVSERFAVYGGFLEMRDDVVSVLSDDAEPAAAIDLGAAEVEQQRLEREQAGAEEESPELRRARARVAIAQGN